MPGLSTRVLVVVQTMDRYARKTPKTLVVVHDLDRYEHHAGIRMEVCQHYQATEQGGMEPHVGGIGRTGAAGVANASKGAPRSPASHQAWSRTKARRRAIQIVRRRRLGFNAFN